ncbi:MAG: radical SAM protein [archaeon]
MHQIALNSDLLTHVTEGDHTILFDFKGNSFLYERLGNTIHSGERATLEHLAQGVQGRIYKPVFDAKSMLNQFTGKIGSLILGITEDCNMLCQYCYNSEIYTTSRDKTSAKMDWVVAKAAIDLLLKNSDSRPKVQFFGGEPSLELVLLEKCMEYALSLYSGSQFGITTNGLRLHDLTDIALRYNMKVTVSLDGPKKIHDKYRLARNKFPTFDLVDKGLRDLIEMNPEFVRSNVTLAATCWDPEDFPVIVANFLTLDKFFSAMYVDFVEPKGMLPDVRGMHASKHSVIDDFLSYGLAYIDNILHGNEQPKLFRTFFDKQMTQLYYRSREKMPAGLPLDEICVPGQSFIFVNHKGEVFLCEKMEGYLPIGNNHEGIDTNAQRESVYLLKGMRDQLCTDCWADRICNPCVTNAKNSARELTATDLSESCTGFKDTKIVYLALFGELLRIDNKKLYEAYFKTANFEL